MRIGELGRQAGLSVKALRFYEDAGVLPAARRLTSGYRDYDSGALDRLRFIKAAQAAGLTLAEIRQVIAVREDVGPPCEHVTDLLNAHVADLDRRIVELGDLHREVSRLQARARTLDPQACNAASVCHVFPAPLP